ncbi:MAG: chorismate mutase [Clostridia bacterium]|nr:chorismate mutase [Clostridia bacterium]
MSKLDDARAKIGDIDKKIAALFEERMDAAGEVAAYKREHGLKVEDRLRESELLDRNCGYIKNSEYKPYYVNFQKSVMDISKAYQHRLLDGMRVAFSGTTGAFANIAAEMILPDAECIGYGDFAEAYNSVVNGDCDSVVLPLENSVGGDVGTVLDLCFFGSLFVNGVYETDIIQNLLAVEGATVNDIKTVISHPQALGQCADFIKQYGFEQIEAVNTAIAAKHVKEQNRRDLAAIGSSLAAEKFGLKIIAPHINQSSTNTTRFAVLSRAAKAPSDFDDRFIMLFTVKNVAGALGDAITIIGKHGFNLRALKSRPTKQLIWNYYFYAEGEGNINSAEGKKMLEDLKSCCLDIKILGSYEKEIHL